MSTDLERLKAEILTGGGYFGWMKKATSPAAVITGQRL